MAKPKYSSLSGLILQPTCCSQTLLSLVRSHSVALVDASTAVWMTRGSAAALATLLRGG
jgi:hypothetical protein